MDGTKFDKFARMLAGGTSRRGLLKRAAVVAAGVAVARTPFRARAAAEATHCLDKYGECTEYCEYGYEPTHKICEKDYACIPYGECCGYAPKGYVCDYGEWVCPADYYVAYDETCIPKDSCTTDYDCTAKNQICSYGKDVPVALTVPTDSYYGTCICDYGYKLNDKGKCIPEEGSCYSDEDCYKSEYSYYEYKDDGYYYDEYGNKLPHLICNDYGTCEEVPYEEPPVIEEPPKEPPTKPDDCVKTCVARKRKQAKGRKSGKRSKGGNVRKTCQKYCAAKRRKRG